MIGFCGLIHLNFVSLCYMSLINGSNDTFLSWLEWNGYDYIQLNVNYCWILCVSIGSANNVCLCVYEYLFIKDFGFDSDYVNIVGLGQDPI